MRSFANVDLIGSDKTEAVGSQLPMSHCSSQQWVEDNLINILFINKIYHQFISCLLYTSDAADE